MAIKILNVGAAAGILSISYNKGVRGEIGKIVVKKLGSGSGLSSSTISNLGGFNIGSGWRQLSSITGNEPGGTVTTTEFIDGSYILDTKNILLFKRNINGVDGNYIATKTVKIPVVSFSFSGGGGSFTITMEDRNISVERKKSNGTSGILGKEEWSSNPCEPSAVSYKCSEALSLIGIAGAEGGDLDCAFEGSYRSVLTSITAKLGKMWYWNGSGPAIFGSNDVAFPTISDSDCKVYSRMEGLTLEGASSVSSWTYQRIKVPTRSAKRTVEIYEYPETSPVKHPDYPSNEELILDSVGSYREYLAYRGALGLGVGFDASGLRAMGNMVTANYTMIFAYSWSAVWLLGINIFDFALTFGLVPENASGNYYIQDDFRTTVFKLMGVQSNWVNLDGFVRILGGWQQKVYEKEKVTELFYPAPTIDSHSFSGNAKGWKTVDVEVDPSPERRGLDPNDDSKSTPGTGIWRGTSVDIKDEDPNGPSGQNSEAWGAAIAESFKPVQGDILSYIFDGPIHYKRKTGSFRAALNNGFQIWSVVPTPGTIKVSSGGGTNRSDLTATKDYVDPNELPPVITPEQQESEDDAKEYDDPCEDLIQKELDSASEGDDEPIIIGNKNGRSGLNSADGGGFTATATAPGVPAAKFSGAFPSMSSFTWKVKTTYQFSVIAEGTLEASNVWAKSGPLNGSGDVLNHSIVVTEIPSPDQVPEEIEVPEAAISSGSVPLAEYVVNGFYLPVDHPALESLSATLDPEDGLVVSYRYRGVRPEPLTEKLIISPNAYQVNINVS